MNPSSTPMKRTALGRAAHEGATVATARNGKAVIYMGEDARFEYIYKFVSRDAIQPGDASANAELLNHGTLYVAKFDSNGKGGWLALHPRPRPAHGGQRLCRPRRSAHQSPPGQRRTGCHQDEPPQVDLPGTTKAGSTPPLPTTATEAAPTSPA